MKREIDETLLTAYALGELDARERGRIDALVAEDVDARRFVEAVRDTAGTVTEELGREWVEGLGILHRAVIERRIAELSRPGKSGFATVSLRLRRWLPLAASVAASILIVGATLAYLLPRLYQPTVMSVPKPNEPSGPGIAVIEPSEAIAQPELPPNQVADAARALPTGNDFDAARELANADDSDDEPVEGMVDPREWEASEQARRAHHGSVSPQEEKVLQPEQKVVRGPANSPEAEVVSPAGNGARPGVTPPTPKGGPGSRKVRIYVSPPRDPQAFEEIVKAGVAEDTAVPRVYENPFRLATQRPRSAFPVRVETSSYKFIRRQLLEGQRPPAHRVRIEELLNRFPYRYAPPAEDGPPVAVSVEIATCPWDVNHRLARVALKAREGGATIVARGVQVSLEFNPLATTAWRLIGYENAPTPTSQPTSIPFDIAAGGTATAFYEIQPTNPESRAASARELFTVAVRYRDPHDSAEQKIDLVATDDGSGFDRASEDFRFAASVAAFGMLLRESQFKGTATFADVIRWSAAGKGADETGDRARFTDLARHARDLSR